MGNRNKTTLIAHRIMLGLDHDDNYNGYDNIRQSESPDLADFTGYNTLSMEPERARVIPETAPLYGPVEVQVNTTDAAALARSAEVLLVLGNRLKQSQQVLALARSAR